jgi:hypothetical protein
VDEPTGYHRGRLRWFDGVPPVDHIHARPEPLRVGNEGRAHIILIVQSAGHASVEQAQLPIECRLAVLGYDGLQVLNGGPESASYLGVRSAREPDLVEGKRAANR